MQLFLAFLLLLATAHAATNFTESAKYRRAAAVNLLDKDTTIPATGIYVTLRPVDATPKVIKITSNQKLAVTANANRIATFHLNQTSPGTWTLQEYASGLYVSAEMAGKKSLRATRIQARSWEKFTVKWENADKTIFSLVGINGKKIAITKYSTIVANVDASDVTSASVQFQMVNLGSVPPQIVGASAQSLVGIVGGNIASPVDNQYYPLTVPFALTLFGKLSSNLVVSSNGYISVDTAKSEEDNNYIYEESKLPLSNYNTPTLFPFLHDNYIAKNTPQGIFYQTTGAADAQQFDIEFYSLWGKTKFDTTKYEHFVVTFFQDRPSVYRVKYFQVFDSASAVVGAQRSATGPSITYSFEKDLISNYLVLEFDTAANDRLSA